ncbi:hypothetical protein KM043_016134 [Ampulex compressa]|nr:hypothetical protein KM043_016134 [Ampulex compressa]
MENSGSREDSEGAVRQLTRSCIRATLVRVPRRASRLRPTARGCHINVGEEENAREKERQEPRDTKGGAAHEMPVKSRPPFSTVTPNHPTGGPEAAQKRNPQSR